MRLEGSATSTGRWRWSAQWLIACVGPLGACALLGALTGAPSAARGPAVTPVARAIDFNRDVRPILSQNCFACHGPDAEAREAGLRLDVRDAAISALESGARAIVPGDPGASEVLRRLTAADGAERMPPPESGKSLSPGQVETLRRWIEGGAEYRRHWSFEPPVRPRLPAVSDEAWCATEIDRFVLARLDAEGVAPSPLARREQLLRRVTFDLTGLPPTPEEIEAFVNDDSAGAYERVVDRLLASPRYGEHMARYWLDAARYGDTHGLHLDNARQMWPWRDWVIKAFNDNMPFDRFTVEQLAGDMLPEPTRAQLIATGFNRNHVSTAEGGAIAEEFQIKNVADRVETTSTVWLGLTVACAHCHEHKFDPISHREYYEIFAFFNNTTESPLDSNRADWAPIVRAATPGQEAALEAMGRRIAELGAALDAPAPEIDAEQERWREAVASAWSREWRVLRPMEAVSEGGASLRVLEDGSVLAEGENPAQDEYEIVARTDATGLRLLRLEALTHDALPFRGPGRAENANFVLSEIEAEAVSLADPARRAPVRFAAAAADHEQADGGFLVRSAIDGVADATNGWAVEGYQRREDRTAVFVAAEPFGFEGGTELRVRLRFGTHFAQHAIGRARLAVAGEGEVHRALAPVSFGVWHDAGPFAAENGPAAFAAVFGPELAPGEFDADASFEGGVGWVEQPSWSDGEAHTLEGQACATYLARTLSTPTERRLTLLLGSDDAIKVWLNGRLVHENNVARPLAPDQDRVDVSLPPGESTLLVKVVNFTGGYGFTFRPESNASDDSFVRLALLAGADSLDEEPASALRRYFRRNHSPAMRRLYAELEGATAARDAFEASLPFSLMMQERTERRPTHRLHRGEYDQPREEVEPGIPEALPALGEGQPPDRLGFARWLVDDRNPLTARVTVNRFWQQVFGVGIVKTADDFGAQGEWPSHPELLDWLAVEFRESGWDVKGLMRLLVTSSAYMQDSAVTPELLARDPENRLLGRAPSFRLDAEEIRDAALFAGGILVERVGGPSVKPYQPPGLWEAVAYPDSDTRTFTPDRGPATHRRSLYTYWKRTSPPPNLQAFDAPSRETCQVRRARTSTPLQSLVLLNDPQFVEAARALARRVLRAEAHTEARLCLAFTLLVSREPDADELALLRGLYESELRRYRDAPADAAALLAAGEAKRDASLDASEHAAMTNVAAAILSLHESITKG